MARLTLQQEIDQAFDHLCCYERWELDELVERVRAEERERIARNIKAAEWFTFEDEDVEPGEEFVRRDDAARIAREVA